MPSSFTRRFAAEYRTAPVTGGGPYEPGNTLAAAPQCPRFSFLTTIHLGALNLTMLR